jgi:hypothetical protein
MGYESWQTADLKVTDLINHRYWLAPLLGQPLQLVKSIKKNRDCHYP